ncbi:hypothetical protein [Cryobacterium sp. PH29-G1]|uniref:hypothetical protein n=1 Tax=Cryobacterium sp. PH29-G1 TaxID=3046211 RepID=UPI0024BB6B6C|nr:hypothetical protein [Cryobacterium sp. PH29-G1]MDJ0350782.1 hypothetical protein [Cryobacterium sp. PH29-G1]
MTNSWAVGATAGAIAAVLSATMYPIVFRKRGVRVSARARSEQPDTAHTPTRPQMYLYLALYAFALVGLELVLLAVEPVLGIRADSLLAQIVHWSLTIFVWAGGAIGLTAWARRRTDFKLRADSEAPIGAARWSTVATLVIVTLVAQWVLRGGVLPPFAEHTTLAERFGDAGTVAWLVQVAYYFAELVVIVLIIGFGQRAGDRWFQPEWIPWGGIMLAMTWGLVHFLTQDPSTGIYGVALSLVMGTIYVLTGKSLLITYPILLVIFIL